MSSSPWGMGVTQTQKAEGALTNNHFIPPRGDICFISSLPPELLSRIFELGSEGDGTQNKDEAVDSRDFLRHLDANRVDNDVVMMEQLEEENEGDQVGTVADEKETQGSDVETKEELEGNEVESDEEGASDATGSSDSLPPFQILVSYVCHHWRNVAFSTPSLWTAIGVSARAGLSCEPGLTLLERSKDLPVDICVNCSLDEDEDDAVAPSDDDLRSLFSVLIPHVHRWRTMTIGVPEYHLMYEFLSAASDPSISAASQLTTLELYYNRAAEELDSFGHPNLALFGGSAPLLTTLGLWGVPVDWSQPWIASASNLRDLVLAFHTEDVRPSWTQFATILRGASALEKLALHRSGPSGNPSQWFIEPIPGSPADLNAPIQLLRLTDFTLAFYSQACAIELLHKLHLPALKHLVMEFNDGDYTDFVHELAKPVTSLREQTRSLLFGLESLKIYGLLCSTESVETLYGELQNLTSLKISLWSLPPLFLDILGTPCTLTGRGDVWLPRLAALYVSGTSGHALRDVVQKRRDAGAPLSSLYVEKSCEVDYKDVKWLMENVKTLKFIEEI